MMMIVVLIIIIIMMIIIKIIVFIIVQKMLNIFYVKVQKWNPGFIYIIEIFVECYRELLFTA